MYILGIETSCDETAAAVCRGKEKTVEVLSSVVSSQIDLHKKYGGVIPEIAAREHVLNILPVVEAAIEKAGIKRRGAGKKLSSIAVTTGPGLISSLMVGVETAKALAYVWQVPTVKINHIESHIYANFIAPDNKRKTRKKITFPAVALTVSGGHTMLVLMRGFNKLKILGDTLDDAAGEAFDKAAQMMGLGYPGGPAIAFWAEKTKNKKAEISLPRPMLHAKNYNFSFSGLKTALLYKLKKDKNWKNNIPYYAYEFQQAIIDVLIKKTVKAARDFNAKTVMLSGGVSANKELRRQLEKAISRQLNATFSLPQLKYTTDNAAMVAAAGYFKVKEGKFTPWEKLKTDPNQHL